MPCRTAGSSSAARQSTSMQSSAMHRSSDRRKTPTWHLTFVRTQECSKSSPQCSSSSGSNPPANPRKATSTDGSAVTPWSTCSFPGISVSEPRGALARPAAPQLRRRPASQQALDRAETIDVIAGAAAGRVNRPSLIGCLVGKAAALVITDDPGRERHITDFLTLAAVVTAADLRDASYRPADRSHLANMLGRLANNPQYIALVPESAPGVERLRMSLS